MIPPLINRHLKDIYNDIKIKGCPYRCEDSCQSIVRLESLIYHFQNDIGVEMKCPLCLEYLDDI